MIWSHLSVANQILALKDKYLWNNWFFDRNLSDAPLNEGTCSWVLLLQWIPVRASYRYQEGDINVVNTEGEVDTTGGHL